MSFGPRNGTGRLSDDGDLSSSESDAGHVGGGAPSPPRVNINSNNFSGSKKITTVVEK